MHSKSKGSPHVEELPADLQALLLHTELRSSGVLRELLMFVVALEQTHPAQVLHVLTEGHEMSFLPEYVTLLKSEVIV